MSDVPPLEDIFGSGGPIDVSVSKTSETRGVASVTLADLEGGTVLGTGEDDIIREIVIPPPPDA